MHPPSRRLALGLLLAGSLAAQPKIHPDELKLKPKIDRAIARGVESLIASQLRDGTWGRYGNYDGGKAALCAYALLKCGVSVNHPAVRRAMLYIRGVRSRETYAVACMMLAHAAAGSDEDLARVKQLAKLLISWQRDKAGDYGYPFRHKARPDLSNTQYAALGLWIAQKHKVKIPGKVWRSLLEATLRYQAKPESIVPKNPGHHTTAGGKLEVIGFSYRPRGKATGSMTTAGVSILQICKIGLNERLGRKRRQVENAIDQGLAWLAHHFTVRHNPGARGGWPYYYLYGLERVGSLTRIEKIGNHWWYVRGARHLIRAQKGNGMWQARGGHPEVKTAFALLFLRRATSVAASTGRSSVNATKRHLFSAGGPGDPVQIGGAGQQPLALWIPGFGADLKRQHKPYGIRVVQVEYLDGKRILGQLVGDPTKAWTTDAFLHRAHALRRGPHRIRARVKLVKHDVPPGGTTPTVTIESPVMKVEIRDVFAKWMEAAAKLASNANLLRSRKLTVTATSNPKAAARAADGNDSSHWVCGRKDARPELTIQLDKPVSARKVVLSQAGSRTNDRGHFDTILNVELFLNKSTKPLMIEMNPNQMAVTTFALPRKTKIRSLRLRIVLRVPGRRAHFAGFSEIGLLAK